MSPDSSHTEGASLESCCWPSSALGTACTEPQRLRLHACLATSKVKHILLVSQRTCKAQLPKSNCLQIPPTQKMLALKAVAGPHLSLILLPQSHEDWGSALSFTRPSLNIGAGLLPEACRSPVPKVQTSPHGSHTEGASLESFCYTHLPLALFPKTLNDWASMLALPPER